MKFQSKYHSLVVDYNEKVNSSNIYDFMKSRFYDSKFIFCNHLNDVDEDGEVEVPHSHIYLEFDKRISTQQIINEFFEYYGHDLNPVIIQDKQVMDKNKCIRYLLHLDSPLKTKHCIDELLYNDYSLLQFLEIRDFDFGNLCEIVERCDNLIEVYSKINDINYCARNRSIILDLCFARGIIQSKK